jgi:uncharacterized protein
MQLTKVEWMLLINQLLILEKLAPDEASQCVPMRKALEDGFSLHYGDLFEFMGDDVPESLCKEVIAILQMHRVMNQAASRLGPLAGITAEMLRFRSFDGNTESEALAYANYFIRDMNRFTELAGPHSDLNSYALMFAIYRRMHAAWK